MDNIKDLAEAKQKSQSNSQRLDNHDKEIHKIWDEIKTLYTLNTELKLLAQAVSSMAEKLDEVRVSTGNLTKDIAEIKTEPQRAKAQTADKVLWVISAAVITGLTAFLLNAVAPGVF